MKKIFLFFVGMLIYHVSAAQYNLDDNFIGLSRDYIHSHMHEKGFNTFSPSKTFDNTEYDMYILESLRMSTTFFYKGDTCIRYMELASKKKLNEVTADLDKRYVKIDSLHWINKKQSVNVVLIAPEGETVFSISFTKN